MRPSIAKIVDELTQRVVGNRKVRPQTPLMAIPEHKLLSPSEAMSDHMLLPNLTVQEMKRMNDERDLRRKQGSGLMLVDGQMRMVYKSNREKADDSKSKHSFN